MTTVDKLSKPFRDMLTGIDNETYDTAKGAMWVGILSYLGLTTFNSIHGKFVTDYVLWAAGYAALIAGTGVTLKLKQDTEPSK